MKDTLLFLAALCTALSIAACAPMIENGKDHRHDPRFQDSSGREQG